YVKRHHWIELVRSAPRANRSFAGKVHAINAGLEQLEALGAHFELLGNLDADVSFERDYMEFLLERFARDVRLGVAGPPFTGGCGDVRLRSERLLPRRVAAVAGLSSRVSDYKAAICSWRFVAARGLRVGSNHPGSASCATRPDPFSPQGADKKAQRGVSRDVAV